VSPWHQELYPGIDDLGVKCPQIGDACLHHVLALSQIACQPTYQYSCH